MINYELIIRNNIYYIIFLYRMNHHYVITYQILLFLFISIELFIIKNFQIKSDFKRNILIYRKIKNN